jgi:hypothetical protein
VHDDTDELVRGFRREVPHKVPARAMVISPDDLAPILKASPYRWMKEDPLLAASFVEPVLATWGIESPDVQIDQASGPSL